jgi:2-polyprenyl-6-methoxyphenol hydroxylase-like FAD-dependent oxidoreductase
LIVGAGIAGLAAATLLAWRGIPCLVVERRAAPSRHPSAHGLDLRSLELLRVVPGLEEDLRGATRAEFNDFMIVIAETVFGPELGTLSAAAGFAARDLSPATICSAGHDRIEPILQRHARARGAELLPGTELVDLLADQDGVRARIRDLRSGMTTAVAADFVIAADGVNSLVRQAVGIGVQGPGTLGHAMSILFAADLGVDLRNRSFVRYYLQNPDFVGSFVASKDKDRGQLDIAYDPTLETASELGRARCKTLIRAALGMPDLDVTGLDVVPWEVTGRVARKMAEGRVFLVGDAAHTMPPFGGLGGQVAIQDAADLAWKLAMVVRGTADRALLDTYNSERLPLARLATARQVALWAMHTRPDRAGLVGSWQSLDPLGVAMGYRYRSTAVLDDGTDDGAPVEDPRNPSGRPGTRLAHVALTREGKSISTLDLVGSGFVLLAAREAGAWANAAHVVARASGLPLTSFCIGTDLGDPHEAFLARTGLGPDGALLVRPDGFIAWRSRTRMSDPAAVLADSLARILGWRAPASAP